MKGNDMTENDNASAENAPIDFDYEFEHGERVQLISNYMLTGVVIGEMDWGMKYLVRLDATITPVWFYALELEPEFTKGMVH